MVGFTKKSVRSLTLGEKLKSLRNERRITLGEASRFTKIQQKYLEYLEEGNYKKLPADVYVKGFLRSYADFLGVEEKILIRLYEKEKGIKKNLEKTKPENVKVRKPINISPFVFTPKIIAVFFGILLFLGGFFYLYREMRAFSNAPKLVILNPDPNTTYNANSITVEGVTDKDAKVFINDQPVLVSDGGSFNEDLALQSGANTIIIKAVNRFGKESSQNMTIRSNYREVADKSGSGGNPDPSSGNSSGGSDQNPASSAPNGISLDVSVDPGPVWVSVEADGNPVFSGTMLTGASQTFSASDKIVINSGKGNATHVKFNGKDIGTLSNDPGPVKDVTFTRDTKY